MGGTAVLRRPRVAAGDGVEYDGAMKATISHGWEAETPEAKARWFQSLSVEERLNVFFAFADLALAVRPDLREKKRARRTHGRVRVLELPRRAVRRRS